MIPMQRYINNICINEQLIYNKNYEDIRYYVNIVKILSVL